MSTPSRLLETLRRIPDEIILAIAGQDFDGADGARCVCGWAFRESLARELNVDPAGEETFGASLMFNSADLCAERFGGESGEWSDIYGSAFTEGSGSYRELEFAFVGRLDEIVCGAPTSEGRER